MSFSIGFSVSTRCGWVLGACTAALLLAGVGSAQNLVMNDDFDVSVEFWAPDTLPIFVAEDWEGDPESGSLRLANESPTATNILVSQCVVLAGTEPLIFEGAFRSAISGDTTGRIRIGVSWRTSTDCDVATALGDYLFAVTLDAPEDWTLATSGPIAPPEGAVAADVQLIASKTSAGGLLTADFDAIYVPEPGSAVSGALGAVALLTLRRRRSGAAGGGTPGRLPSASETRKPPEV